MKIDPSAPSFVKIIISPAIDLHKLRIPPAFVKEFRSSLLEHVCIRAPGGEDHRVVLRNEENHIWFSNGWEKFADHYSLDYGHFLMFQYKQNSQFNVFIYDKSCMEIDYRNLDPKISDQDEDQRDDQSEEEEEEDNEDTDDSTDDDYECEEEDDEDYNKIANCKKGTISNFCLNFAGEEMISMALEEAKALKCDNPSFVVSLSHSYLKRSRGFRLWVPKGFARNHLEWVPKGFARNHLEVTNKVTLQVKDDPNTKTWMVSVKRGLNSTHFTDGWEIFAGDNFLQVGDVCVFELINRRDQIYCVHVFHDF